MDFKVYKKEVVKQPTGSEDVYVPDVIDIIPFTEEVPSTSDVRNNVWSLEKLKRIADVKIQDGKLIINSDKVRYENGNLYVTITDTHITGCELVEGRDLIEQQCALATIFQKGLDPLALDDGIRWSEAILEEVSSLQLIQDIIEAVEKVSSSIVVSFEAIEDDEGRTYLSYKLSEVG